MMTLQEAREHARKESVMYSCAQHVNVRIGYDADKDSYGVRGYLVSNWQDDSTVESFTNGRHQRYDV